MAYALHISHGLKKGFGGTCRLGEVRMVGPRFENHSGGSARSHPPQVEAKRYPDLGVELVAAKGQEESGASRKNPRAVLACAGWDGATVLQRLRVHGAGQRDMLQRV